MRTVPDGTQTRSHCPLIVIPSCSAHRALWLLHRLFECGRSDLCIELCRLEARVPEPAGLPPDRGAPRRRSATSSTSARQAPQARGSRRPSLSGRISRSRGRPPGYGLRLGRHGARRLLLMLYAATSLENADRLKIFAPGGSYPERGWASLPALGEAPPLTYPRIPLRVWCTG